MDKAKLDKIIAKYEKDQANHRRYQVKKNLLYKKALAAGLKVSEEEVDKEMARIAKG